MGRRADALSEIQVATLEWIRDGCPTVDEETAVSRRISAGSLRNRGLVATKGNGANWTASITEAGRRWLETHSRPAAEDPGGADDLFARALAADGHLAIGDDYKTKLGYDELVQASNRSPSRPKGWRLEVTSAGAWRETRYEVALVRQFEDLVDELPVPVPERVTRYHPAVKAFLDNRDWQLVGRDHLSRAARILQAITDEAPRRGVEVVWAERVGLVPIVSYQRDREADHPHLRLRSPAGEYGIRIREVSAKGGRARSYRHWDDRSRRAKWLERRDTEFVSTGDLELITEGPGLPYNGYRIADSSTMRLEERLPRIFRRIEIRRLEAEVEKQERERKAAERRRQWEAAMAAARAKYDEQARWDAFVARSREWQDVRQHREFLAAARNLLASVDLPARAELEAHLEFVERRLAALDPLAHPARLIPVVPEPKPDDFKPHLNGWSPLGPEESW